MIGFATKNLIHTLELFQYKVYLQNICKKPDNVIRFALQLDPEIELKYLPENKNIPNSWINI